MDLERALAMDDPIDDLDLANDHGHDPCHPAIEPVPHEPEDREDATLDDRDLDQLSPFPPHLDFPQLRERDLLPRPRPVERRGRRRTPVTPPFLMLFRG